MKKINRLIALFSLAVLTSINVNGQAKKSSELSREEYKKQKIAGNLPNLFPKEFATDKIVVSKKSQPIKEIPKTGLVYSSNKNKNYKSLTTSNCNYTFGYEPPILTPDTDLNGDIVMDTVVKFTNGTAPLYRNDDGSSPAMHLPFTFCFYGDTLNQALYVNNNGNVSFGAAYSTYTGTAFPNTNFVMIAPFWADVDTQDPASGVVYMRRMPHYAIFKWHRVGYFSSNSDKLNSFMLVLTDGTDVHIPNGLNVGFFYDDMQWTTGNVTSPNDDGFGGNATVGANKGDGISYIQFGLFDQPGIAYDGPANNSDGVDWLDNQTFIFSSCSNGTNVPPILTGITVCDTLNACLGDTLIYNIGFLGPETTDSVSIHIIPPTNLTGFSYAIDSISDPSAPILSITYVATQLGNVNFQIWGSDNGNPPLSSDTITVTVRSSVIAGSALSTNAACLNNNGTIVYNLTQGVQPYAISYNNGNLQGGLVLDSLAGGTYNVKVEDAAGCSLDTSIFIFQPVGINSIVTNDGPYCPGATINLTGTPDSTSVGATYQWFDANGNVVGTTPNITIPNASTSNSGYYKLTITHNACAGLSDSTEVLLGTPIVNSGIDTTTCNTNAISFNGILGGTATTYDWSTTGLGTFNFTTNPTATYTPNTADVVAGHINIILTSGPVGCEVSDTLKLAFDAPVSANISTTTSKVCKGGTVTLAGSVSNTSNYLWSVTPSNAGTISNPSNANAAFNAIGTSATGTIKLTAISGNSCPNESVTIPMIINPNPTVSLSGAGYVGVNQTFCPPTAANITFNFSGGTGPFVFNYINGTSNFSDSTLVGNNSYNVPSQNITKGTYQIVNYRNAEGCSKNNSGVDSVQILGLAYDINFTTESATCGKPDGKVTAIVASNITAPFQYYNYYWTGFSTPGDASDSVTHKAKFSNIDIIPQVYGGKDYKLLIKDTLGCKYSETIFLNLKQGIFASVLPDSIEGIAPFKFSFKNTTLGDSILNFTYIFGDNSDNLTVLNTLTDTLDNDTASHVYKADFDTSYIFVIHAKSEIIEQCDDYDTIIVKIRVPVNVKTFNVLSLTDDNSGKNNAFKINPSGVLDVTCLIYDRWGNKVKDFSNPGGQTWDGVIWDNIDSGAGTYYYILNYNFKKDSIRQAAAPKTGFIQIIR